VNPERSRIIPAAPGFSSAPTPGVASSFAIVKSGDATKLGFSWTPVDGAASYRVEVSSDPAMASILTRANVSTTSYVIAEQSTTGRFFARVRAVSAEGIVGGWTKPRALRIVRATYPDNAVVAKDGTIIVPENGVVSLKDVEGLEVAVQNFDGKTLPPPVGLYWIPAPSALRLGDHGSRLYRIRDSVLGSEAQIVLGRRELKADVTMCPTRARWPEHPVGIRVLLQDPSGRIDVSCEPLTFETTVNLEPVSVEWHQTGNWWWAVVPPQAPPGPWAVRIVVKDKLGTEIGRGHLEVDGPQAPKGGAKGSDVTEVRVTH
jgi:hypothetical protein